MKRGLSWIPALVLVAGFLLIAVVGPRVLISGMRLPPLRTAAEAGLTRYEDEVAPPWGTHTKSYVLYPQEYVEKVVAFFNSRFGQR